jgi:quercetin dioxygenase-like cupin family protein
MSERINGKVDKGWGYEIIWSTNDLYCGKILVFEKAGARTSMHYHKEKDKSWFVNAGQFLLIYIDTNSAEIKQITLKEGDTWRISPLQPHQLIALHADSTIIEVSTSDSNTDTFRISPGDSQPPPAPVPPAPPSQ